jgi:hypothetical protein
MVSNNASAKVIKRWRSANAMTRWIILLPS